MKTIIDGYEYDIIADENNVYCVTPTGESLTIIEYSENSSSEFGNQIFSEYPASTYGTVSWILVAQHLKGTNTHCYCRQSVKSALLEEQSPGLVKTHYSVPFSQ